jgi:hypothetical protein
MLAAVINGTAGEAHVKTIDKIPPPAPASACAILSLCCTAADATFCSAPG